MVRIYNPFSGNLIRSLNGRTAREKLPITCCRWRPETFGVERGKYVITAANVEGSILQWHGKHGEQIKRLDLPGSQFFSLDYNSDGTSFCVGGQDAHIRLIDEETWQIGSTMEPRIGNSLGHSNGIFATKYLNDH